MQRDEPPLTLQDRLTLQFYDWELRGRGWNVYPQRVVLEPPFRPFLGHAVPWECPPPDDGRRETVLSRIAERLRALAGIPRETPESTAHTEIAEPDVEPAPEPSPRREFVIAVPPDAVTRRGAAEAMLLALGATPEPVSFEIGGTGGRVDVRVSAAQEDADRVADLLRAFVPDGTVAAAGRSLDDLWRADQVGVVVDYGLEQEFVCPLRVADAMEPDPLLALYVALESLGADELGVFQVLFTRALAPWPESAMRAVSSEDGTSFFSDAPQLLALAREKVRLPLFAVTVRVAGQATQEARAEGISERLGVCLDAFTAPGSNRLVPLAPVGYPWILHTADFLARSTRRPGMLLNAGELAGLVHVPGAAVRVPGLVRHVRRTYRAPEALQGPGILLGVNEHRGERVEVRLPEPLRLRHLHLVGASGTGKTTLLTTLMAQDLAAGAGFALLDPHGDVADEILGRVPDGRLDEVVLLDPGDPACGTTLNVLEAHSDLERTLLASDLVALFERFSTSWGDQMTAVLGNAVAAFLASPRGGTLAELRRFLVETEFRRDFLSTVSDPHAVYFWQREFLLLHGKSQASILTRLDAFLRPPTLRRILAARQGSLDLRRVMDEGRILVVKLAQGAIGEENAALLGALLVSKLHQAALSRQESPAASRRPFFLYVDEFHAFATPSMTALLSGARKFGVGLVLAHQDLRQLGPRASGLGAAVLTNPATRIAFRVSEEDARVLAEGFAVTDARELLDLGVGEAICRVERRERTCSLRTVTPEPVPGPLAARRHEAIRARNRVRAAQEVGAPPCSEAQSEPIPQPEPVPSQVPPQAAKARARAEPATTLVASAGRGGAQHRYLQTLIAKYAESHGYAARVEEPILAGHGFVDVGLTRGAERIACEIWSTTSADHEFQNVGKCLAAGYDRVFVVIPDGASRRAASTEMLSRLSAAEGPAVRCVSPDELLQQLAAEPQAATPETRRVRGYRVTVRNAPPAGGTGGGPGDAVSRILASALRRMRDR